MQPLTSDLHVQTCAGLFYCFSVYAPAIKQRFGLHQTQIQSLGSALILGGYLAFPGGLLYEYTAHHPLGPRYPYAAIDGQDALTYIVIECISITVFGSLSCLRAVLVQHELWYCVVPHGLVGVTCVN